MKSALIVCAAALLVTGCTSSQPEPWASATGPVPDASLGLAKGSVFDVPTPPGAKPNETAPGERPALPRPYLIAPPRVPHAVDDFLSITGKQNTCLECHEVKEKKAGSPTPIPPSHYTDYRNAPERVDSRLAGARHVCVACHVATTDASSLVENRFRP